MIGPIRACFGLGLVSLEFAFFDIYPDDDDAHYNGLWGVYPYLPSGATIGSDIEKGLFVWTFGGTSVPSSSPPGILASALLIAMAGAFLLRSRTTRGRGKPGPLCDPR